MYVAQGTFIIQKLVRDDELLTVIGIEFHSLGAVYEYDLLNREERGLGTANAPLTGDRIRLSHRVDGNRKRSLQ